MCDEQKSGLSAAVCTDARCLTPGLIVGAVTITVLEVHFYVTGGCGDEREARRDYGDMISSHMCCDTEWVVGAVGLGSCGLLVLSAVPNIYRARGLFGRCCCCCGRGKDGARYVAVLLAIVAVGLVILSVVQMCWSAPGHAFGAFFFFAAGGVMVLFVNATSLCCCSTASSAEPREMIVQPLDGGLPSPEQPDPLGTVVSEQQITRVVRITGFVIGLVGIAAGLVDSLVAEWLIIASIATIVSYVQLRLWEAEAQEQVNDVMDVATCNSLNAVQLNSMSAAPDATSSSQHSVQILVSKKSDELECTQIMNE